MIYLNSFLFAGLLCFIGEVIYLHSKLTLGHITTLFVIIGAILGGIGVYDIIIDLCGGGATALILNFGNLLVKGGLEGAKVNGFFGIFQYLFKYVSTTLGYVIFLSILMSLLPRVRIIK